MGVAPFVTVGVADSVPDDLADPALPPLGLFECLPGKDRGGEEVLKTRLGIVVAAVHVPRLRVGGHLEHHGKLCPFSRVASSDRSWKNTAHDRF